MLWVLKLMVVLVGLVLLRELLIFLIIRRFQKLGQHASSQKDRFHARKFWELALKDRSPIFSGEWFKQDTRFRLAWLLIELRKPAEAAEQCRILLQQNLKPYLRAQALDRYSECLLALDDETGAVEARHNAIGNLADQTSDVKSLLLHAQMLMKEMRFLEAIALYDRVLTLLAGSRRDLRTYVMVQLAIAFYDAGRPYLTVSWSKTAISEGVRGTNLYIAHKMAGIGYSTLGQLEQAEQHWEQALSDAERAGDSELRAICRLSLATIQMRRGRLGEAYAESRQALEMNAKVQRRALLMQADVLRAWGRFDEAVILLRQAIKISDLPAVHTERRSRAHVWMSLVWTECEAERPEPAQVALQQVIPVFAKDARLSLHCLAFEALISAQRGDHSRAEECIARATQDMANFAEDPVTLSICLSRFARATMYSGAFGKAIAYWERALATKPDPVSEPNGWYYLGECYRALGNLQAATEAYQRAVAIGVDTYTSTLARRRLAEQTK